jgi:hypothetical protein
MTELTFDPTEPVAPSAADTIVARESARHLVDALPRLTARCDCALKTRMEPPNP